jgi:hypothetical protein
MSTGPTPASPLTGGCACGAVRFAITAPLVDAGYCHCRRCQQRTGTAAALNGMTAPGSLQITEGAELVGVWRPAGGGNPKSFCTACGGALWAGEPSGEGNIAVRFGALDGDPGIAPRWRQWLDSAPAWEPIPQDGLPRFAQRRPLQG